MKLLAGGLVAAALIGCNAARADGIDLSEWTCKQFRAASQHDIGIILAWLDGYYKEEDQPPIIGTEALVANAGRLGEYCAAHPGSVLIDATDKLFQQE